MTREEILREIERRLREAFGPRYRGAVLYGSEARGEAREDSDYDILVLLSEPMKLEDDIMTAIDAVYPLQLEIIKTTDRTIHTMPVDIEEYNTSRFPFYAEVHREGVRL